MARARNAIGNTLVLAGVAMVIFAMLWWGLAVRRIVVFPAGFELSTPCEGTVERRAGKHGMLKLTPAQKQEFRVARTLTSLDGDYRRDIAVVQETVKPLGEAPFGLNLAERNIYVMNRRSCENLRSGMSTSAGQVVDRSGSWYVNFPFSAGRQSRNVFDNTTGSAFAVNYEREGVSNRVRTYIFRGSHGFRPLLDYQAAAMGLPTVTTFGEETIFAFPPSAGLRMGA